MSAWPRTLLLYAVSFIAGIAIVEAIAHLWYTNPGKINHRDFYEEDQVLGWKKKPNAFRNIKTWEFESFEQTNSRGLRAKEHQYEKAHGEFRILVLGDSFAEGYTVDLKSLFSELLREHLSSRDGTRIYEVINAGTIGYGTDQELLFFEIEGKNYNPDMVMLLFFENDVLENVSEGEIYGRHKRLFRIVGGKLVLDDQPSQSRESEQNARQELRRSFWPYPDKLLSYRIVRQELARIGVIKISEQTQDCDHRFFEVLATHESEWMDHAWRVTELILKRLNEEVLAINSHLVVFYIPSAYSLDPTLWEKTANKCGLFAWEWDFVKPENRLREICQRSDIPFVSLGESFRREIKQMGVSPGFFYHLRDGHWNAQGHKHVARIMADYIATSPRIMLKGRPEELTTEPPP